MSVLLTIFWCAGHSCTPVLSNKFDTMEQCQQSGEKRVKQSKTNTMFAGHYYSCILLEDNDERP